MMVHKKFILIGIVLMSASCFQINGYEPIFVENSEQPFVYPCPADQFIFAEKTGNLYLATSSNEFAAGLDSYAFALLPADQNKLAPFIKEKAFINLDKKTEQDNPLLHKGLRHLVLISKNDIAGMQSHVELPVVVTQDEPNIIYLFESNRPEEKISLMRSAPVTDGLGRIAGEIVALEAGGGYVFAAVSPVGGSFGDIGSAIAVFMRGFVKYIEPEDSPDAGKEKTNITFQQIATMALDRRLMPIQKDTHVLLRWDESLGRLFIAYKSQSGAGLGLQGVAVARFSLSKKETRKEHRERLEVAAKKKREDDAKKAEEKAFADKAAKEKSSKKVDQKNQSDVAQKNKKIDQTPVAEETLQEKIFPIFVMEPIISRELLSEYASIAPADDPYLSGYIEALSLLHTTSQLPYCLLQMKKTVSEEESYVYALALTGGSIEEIRGQVAHKNRQPADTYRKWPKGCLSFFSRFISENAKSVDAFAASSDPSSLVGNGPLKEEIKNLFVRGEGVFAVTSSGIYASQAILDVWGKVKGWTSWTKHLSMPVNEQLCNVALNAKFGTYILLSQKETNEYEIKRTSWASAPFSVSSENDENSLITAFCLLDNNEILFAQGDHILRYDSSQKVFIDRIEHFSGRIHAIESKMRDGELIIFVAGQQGLAAYTKNQEGSDLWVHLGEYKDVRKLFIDGEWLYVLTRNSLDKILINQKSILQQKIERIHLASTNEFKIDRYGSFCDLLVSGHLGLLATTKGLYRTANGMSIAQADEEHSVSWNQVEIPEGLLPVLKLIPVTWSRKPQDLATGPGGHVYVLTAYQGKNQAHINRFSVASLDVSGVVTDDTIAPFNDYYLKDFPSHFMDLCSMNTDFITDGAFSFFVADFSGKTLPSVWLPWERLEPAVGLRFMGVRRSEMWKAKEKNEHVLGIKLVPGLGWMLVSSSGVLVAG